MFHPKKRAALAVAILLALLLCACTDSAEKPGSSSQRQKSGQVLISRATEKKTIGNAAAVIDISNADQGYICVKYLGSNKKVKLQLTNGQDTYTYNLLKRGSFEVFPLSEGSGTYTAGVFENISGSQYSQACSETFKARLKDENLPFLYPNEYVSYTAKDPVVKLSGQVTEKSADDLDKVKDIFNYVIKNIHYDYRQAANVQTDYLPDITEVLKNKKGICFDYASLMSAMLRIQNIPTKLVAGYAGNVYHAWISVYIKDKGWVDGIIKFDGKDWTMMDPTAASSGEMEDITKDSRYNALFYY